MHTFARVRRVLTAGCSQRRHRLHTSAYVSISQHKGVVGGRRLCKQKETAWALTTGSDAWQWRTTCGMSSEFAGGLHVSCTRALPVRLSIREHA